MDLRTVEGVDWPAAEPIETARLTLEPLRVEHAGEMVEVLSAPALYEYIGGRPPSLEQLRARYTRQAVGHSPDGREGWLNWIARERETGIAVGTVQATLTNGGAGRTAELAWVIGAAHQRRGYATEAAAAMVEWLRAKGIDTVILRTRRRWASPGVSASPPPTSPKTGRPAGRDLLRSPIRKGDDVRRSCPAWVNPCRRWRTASRSPASSGAGEADRRAPSGR